MSRGRAGVDTKPAAPALATPARAIARPHYVLALAPTDGVAWAESQSYHRLKAWSASSLEDVPCLNVWRSPEHAARGRRDLVATGRAGELAERLEGAAVLVLGRRLAWLVWGIVPDPWAFQIVGSHLEPSRWTSLYILPHPSGRNALYNRPEAQKRAGELVSLFLRGR